MKYTVLFRILINNLSNSYNQVTTSTARRLKDLELSIGEVGSIHSCAVRLKYNNLLIFALQD